MKWNDYVLFFSLTSKSMRNFLMKIMSTGKKELNLVSYNMNYEMNRNIISLKRLFSLLRIVIFFLHSDIVSSVNITEIIRIKSSTWCNIKTITMIVNHLLCRIFIRWKSRLIQKDYQSCFYQISYRLCRTIFYLWIKKFLFQDHFYL